jgi:hypothetical protein
MRRADRDKLMVEVRLCSAIPLRPAGERTEAVENASVCVRRDALLSLRLIVCEREGRLFRACEIVELIEKTLAVSLVSFSASLSELETVFRPVALR